MICQDRLGTHAAKGEAVISVTHLEDLVLLRLRAPFPCLGSAFRDECAQALLFPVIARTHTHSTSQRHQQRAVTKPARRQRAAAARQQRRRRR